MFWCLIATKSKPCDQIPTVLVSCQFCCTVLKHGHWQRLNGQSCKHSTCGINVASSTSSGQLYQQQQSLMPDGAVWRIIIRETVQQRRLSLFGHVAPLPTVIPASAAFSIASTVTLPDGVSPMPDWKHPFHSMGHSTQDLAEQWTYHCTALLLLLMHFNWLLIVRRGEQ